MESLSQPSRFTPRRIAREIALNVAICLAIGYALEAIGIAESFATSAVFALCIGGWIHALALGGAMYWDGRLAPSYVAAVAVPVGTAAGALTSALLVGFPNTNFINDPSSLAFTFVVAAIVCALFVARRG